MAKRDDGYRLHYQAHELLPGEQLVASWTAERGKGLTSAGGTLVLTTQRVLFEPLRTPKDALLGPVAKLFGFGEMGKAVNAGIDATGSLDQWSVPLHEIAAVRPLADRRWLEIARTSGETWAFGISAGLWVTKGSDQNAAERDRAVAAIAAAVGGERAGGGAPSSPEGMWAQGFEAGLAEAARTGQPVTLVEEEGVRFIAYPDGYVRVVVGEQALRPAGASVAPNLVGDWRTEALGPDEVVTLQDDGRVDGRLQLFGAIPPLEIVDGAWWMDGTSVVELHFALAMPAEALDEGISHIELNLRLTITYLGDQLAVLKWEGGEVEELAVRRAVRTPRGTWTSA
jgi:hypothetical protein